MDAEKQFSQQWQKNVDAARGLDGYNPTRLLQSIEERGGVAVAERMLERNGCSENFEILKKNNRLDLSLEAMLTRAEFGGLFADEVVNTCLALLCECNYFG